MSLPKLPLQFGNLVTANLRTSMSLQMTRHKPHLPVIGNRLPSLTEFQRQTSQGAVLCHPHCHRRRGTGKLVGCVMQRVAAPSATAGAGSKLGQRLASQDMEPLLSPSDKYGSPNSYLQDGQRWVRYERGLFRLGKLRSDAPPEVHLVQEMSRRLHQEYREDYEEGPDGDWSFRDRLSFRKIADKCGLRERALHDLWHGNSWPTLRTIARLEMLYKDLLWNKHHIAEHGRKQGERQSRPDSVQQAMELP